MEILNIFANESSQCDLILSEHTAVFGGHDVYDRRRMKFSSLGAVVGGEALANKRLSSEQLFRVVGIEVRVGERTFSC